jgi:tRNA (Thr-GGU) A37 N-methylase
MSVKLKFMQIGVIRTPYIKNAPYQPVDEDEGEFRIVVDEKYADGLVELKSFTP